MKNSKSKIIEVPAIDIRYLQLKLVGDSPLIVHRWTEKAKKEISEGKGTKSKVAKNTEKITQNPYAEFCSAIYWLKNDGTLHDFDWYSISEEEAHEQFIAWCTDHKFGFPSIGFKNCAIDAAYQQGIYSVKTTPRGAIHIMDEFTIIEGSLPTMREDMVKLSGIGAAPQLRYRPSFSPWSATLQIKYNAGAISAEQIANFFNMGGFANGVGEWRPGRNGIFGTFHVE